MHFPKHPNCEFCNRCKIQHSQHRAKKDEPISIDDDAEHPKEFADKVTMEHIIMGSGKHSVDKDQVSLVCLDRFYKWSGAFPDKRKETESVVRALQIFFWDYHTKVDLL